MVEQWTPKIIAAMNDYHLKIAKIEGDFVWHSHPDTDDLFYVLSGRLTIQMRDADVVLEPGELFVVPAGVEHMPVADEECWIMMIEDAGTLNTGEQVSERSKHDLPLL